MTLTQAEKPIADKILHILSTYPQISPSMLQISLGSGLPTSMWKPVLEKLIAEGKVFRSQRTSESPNGRMQASTIISLEAPEDHPPSD